MSIFGVVRLTIQPRANPDGPPRLSLPDPPVSPVRQSSPPGLVINLIEPLSGLEVIGEIDRTTRTAWQEALAAVASRGEDVHLYLAELGFIDVRGTWLITDTAGTLPAGKRMFLHHPPRILKTVLTLIGSGSLPVVVESP
ncbi:anti sigma factor [Planomonospora sphaerica]|uniref:Anti sigma factor n=1 Tax=Planomonospora sphaerica TaxID=161355 RepID=A0A171DMJ4_9ACTN|nr:anti sigma factor [Planomonospora sphaerica]